MPQIKSGKDTNEWSCSWLFSHLKPREGKRKMDAQGLVASLPLPPVRSRPLNKPLPPVRSRPPSCEAAPKISDFWGFRYRRSTTGLPCNPEDLFIGRDENGEREGEGGADATSCC